MKRLHLFLQKHQFATILVTIAFFIFTYAAHTQLSKEQSTQQQLKSKCTSDYFALFYHYRNCVSYILFSDSPEEIRKYAEQAEILQLKMKELETELLQTKLSDNDKQSLELLISTQRLYVEHTNTVIINAQKQSVTLLYSKTTKLGLLLIAICLTLLAKLSKRSKIRVRNHLISLKQYFSLTPIAYHHKPLKLQRQASKA